MTTPNDALNPVVMLNGRVWHVVDRGRDADYAVCGRALNDRRAHSRLRTVGRENVCPACLALLPRVDES